MEEKIKKEIWNLYFNKMYSYEEIIAYYNNKFTYAELKKVIKERFKMFEEK